MYNLNTMYRWSSCESRYLLLCSFHSRYLSYVSDISAWQSPATMSPSARRSSSLSRCGSEHSDLTATAAVGLFSWAIFVVKNVITWLRHTGLYGNKKHFMSSSLNFTNKTELKIAKFLEWVWSKHWISYHEPSSKRKLDLKPETSFSHSHLYPFCFVPSALLDLTWQRNPISNHLNNRKSMSEISHANILNPYRSSCRMTQHKFYFLNKISQRESYEASVAYYLCQ